MHIPRIQINATFEATADSEPVHSPDGDIFHQVTGDLDVHIGSEPLAMRDGVTLDFDEPIRHGEVRTLTAHEDPESFGRFLLNESKNQATIF
jgi:hypothetical protein